MVDLEHLFILKYDENTAEDETDNLDDDYLFWHKNLQSHSEGLDIFSNDT